MYSAFEQLWASMSSYGCLDPEIIRRWVLWALRKSYKLIYGFSTALKQYQFVWLSGPGNKSKMVLWATRHPLNFIRILNSFEAVWLDMVFWARKQIEDGCCELSASPPKFYVIWTPLKQYGYICFLGPEISRTRLLWDIKHSTNLYGFWTGLKQCEFIWFSGRRNKSKMGPVSYHTPYKVVRLVNSFETIWIHMLFWARK